MSAGREGRPASGALHTAVCAGDVRAVQLLAAHEELLNLRREDDQWAGCLTPLELAVAAVGWRTDDVPLPLRLRVAQTLLDAGANLAASPANGVSCIHIAAWRWPRKSTPELWGLARRLCAAAGPALLDAQLQENGRTALHEAAKVRTWFGLALVEAGASCSVRDTDGDTPADTAAMFGHTELLKVLLDKTADALQQEDIEMLLRSAIYQAHTLGGTSDAACGRRLDVLEELFGRQRVREAALVPDRNGQTFLFYMAQWGGFSQSRSVVFDTIVEAALELGVDINHQDNNGDTVLHVGVRAVARRASDGCTFIARWIRAGAHASILNADGLRAFDVLDGHARQKCRWSLIALQQAEQEEAAPARETRQQRYLRRSGGAAGDAAAGDEAGGAAGAQRLSGLAHTGGAAEGAVAAADAAAVPPPRKRQRGAAGDDPAAPAASAAVQASADRQGAAADVAALLQPSPKRLKGAAAVGAASAAAAVRAPAAAPPRQPLEPPPAAVTSAQQPASSALPSALQPVQQQQQPGGSAAGPGAAQPVQLTAAVAAPPASLAKQQSASAMAGLSSAQQAQAAAAARAVPAEVAPELEPATAAAAPPAPVPPAPQPAVPAAGPKLAVAAAGAQQQPAAAAAQVEPAVALHQQQQQPSGAGPVQQPPAAAAAAAAARAAVAGPLPPPPPAAPQLPAPAIPRQQLAAILQRCTEAGALGSRTALVYRFGFGRLSAEEQAEELGILSELEAEGALAEVADCVQLAVQRAKAAAQQE